MELSPLRTLLLMATSVVLLFLTHSRTIRHNNRVASAESLLHWANVDHLNRFATSTASSGQGKAFWLVLLVMEII